MDWGMKTSSCVRSSGSEHWTEKILEPLHGESVASGHEVRASRATFSRTKNEGKRAAFHDLQVHGVARDRKIAAVLGKIRPVPTEAGQILPEKPAGNGHHRGNDPLVGETGKIRCPWPLEAEHAAAHGLAFAIFAPAMPDDNQVPVTPLDQIAVGFEPLQ
jgi:hypothetical protein